MHAQEPAYPLWPELLMPAGIRRAQIRLTDRLVRCAVMPR
jgi:hypothetical protein